MQGVGVSLTMQIIARLDGTSKRPFVLITPHIRAHHKELDRSLIEHTCIDTLQEGIKPAQLQAYKIDPQINQGRARRKPEIQFADRIGENAVCPWTDEQFALTRLRSAPLLTHNAEILDGILQKDIIPSPN